MALKIDISEKYKPEFPFIDDSEAMEKLSYESFIKAVDNHIKKLHKEGGFALIMGFRDEYQKRLDFVRSELEHSPDNRELKNCELCYSYCVDRAYYFTEHPALLKDERLPKECLDKLREITNNHPKWGTKPTFITAYDCEDCKFEIVNEEKERIGSWATLRRRVKEFYPDLYEKTKAQK